MEAEEIDNMPPRLEITGNSRPYPGWRHRLTFFAFPAAPFVHLPIHNTLPLTVVYCLTTGHDYDMVTPYCDCQRWFYFSAEHLKTLYALEAWNEEGCSYVFQFSALADDVGGTIELFVLHRGESVQQKF